MKFRIANAAVLLTVMLGGCASNAIRVQRAGEMAVAGEAASAETGKFLGKVRASQREANVALVASDPSCQWGPSIIIMGTNDAGPLPRPLCSPPPANSSRGDFEYKLSSDYRSAQRAAGLAKALAAYSAAVGAIVAGDEIDARDSLAEAFGIVSALQSDLAIIAGTRAPVDDAQSAAIGKLVGLINELNIDRIKVELRWSRKTGQGVKLFPI